MHTLHFQEIDSTSTYLKRNYENLPNLTFVSASFQTNGHGRYDRKWISNKEEDLLFSLLIKDKKYIDDFSSLSIKSAVAIIKVLEDIYKIDNVSLKWPNDVFINDKKVCGILLESISNDNNIDCLIVGIGLNVNSSDFKGDFRICPTSLQEVMKKPLEIDLLKKHAYESLIDQLDNNDYLEFVRKHNYLKGKTVYSNVGKITVKDIDDNNNLVAEKDNQIIHLNTGEISFHLE